MNRALLSNRHKRVLVCLERLDGGDDFGRRVTGDGGSLGKIPKISNVAIEDILECIVSELGIGKIQR
jgi:hypothetical protein